MIDNIFGYKTNLLILRFLTKFDNQFFTPDEIAKEIWAGLRNVKDSLRTLTYEKILEKKISLNRAHYKFAIKSPLTGLIYNLFEEERRRVALRTSKIYKILSEIESKVIKTLGLNLVDIILFGSISKGRDTVNSDIDLCVLVEQHNQLDEKKLRALSFENKFSNEIQFHIFTLDDFIRGKENNPLIKNILRDGISLKIGE